MGGKKPQHYAFFQDAIDFKAEFLGGFTMCSPPEGCASFVPFLSQTRQYWKKQGSKLIEKKVSRSILLLWKASSPAMLEMRELVPFAEAKCRVLPLWCQLLALRKPRGTRSCSLGVKTLLRAISGACLCKSSSSAERRTISSPPLA